MAYAAGMISEAERPGAMPSAPGWEHFHHEADIGVRGFGHTPAQAFEQTALAMTAVIVDPSSVQARDTLQIEVSGPDAEMLLYEWLNSLVYEMATRKMLFGQFRVEIADGELRGTAQGEPIDVARHRPTVEIKGATFTELAVRQRDDGLWLAQCVVDV
jgi:SHS2 domain-containing protein